MADASVTSDRETRFALFHEAEKLLMKQLPILPLYYYTSMALISPDVKGWYPNILDQHPYKSIYLEKDSIVKKTQMNRKDICINLK